MADLESMEKELEEKLEEKREDVKEQMPPELSEEQKEINAMLKVDGMKEAIYLSK